MAKTTQKRIQSFLYTIPKLRSYYSEDIYSKKPAKIKYLRFDKSFDLNHVNSIFIYLDTDQQFIFPFDLLIKLAKVNVRGEYRFVEVPDVFGLVFNSRCSYMRIEFAAREMFYYGLVIQEFENDLPSSQTLTAKWKKFNGKHYGEAAYPAKCENIMGFFIETPELISASVKLIGMPKLLFHAELNYIGQLISFKLSLSQLLHDSLPLPAEIIEHIISFLPKNYSRRHMRTYFLPTNVYSEWHDLANCISVFSYKVLAKVEQPARICELKFKN